MINYSEIDASLKYFAKIYHQNPNIPIKGDSFYNFLATYGLNEQENQNRIIDNKINIIEEHFRNAKNINAFFSDRQPQFLQLHNWKLNDSKCVKLYLSYPREYIDIAVNKIFDFIDDNNMPTVSKVSRKLRADSVVIRLRNESDAKAVTEFINNDKELTKYAKPTNPFSLKDGVVGMGYDDNLSYNETVSIIVSNFFKELKSNDNLNLASLDTFREYLNKYYQDTFVNCSKLNGLINSDEYKDNMKRFNNNGKCINNIREITELLLKLINNDLTVDKYYAKYREYKDGSNGLEMSRYYDTVYSQISRSKQINSNGKIDLLNEYLNCAIEKYGIEGTINYLNSYIHGNNNAITRTNGLRLRFINELSPSMLLSMTNNDIVSYVSNYEKRLNHDINGYKIFVEACNATYKKYGVRQLNNAIRNGMSNNYSYFTNGGSNLRLLLKQNVSPEKIEVYCETYLINLGYTITNDDIVSQFCRAFDMVNQVDDTKLYNPSR